MPPSAVPPDAILPLPGSAAALVAWRGGGRLYLTVIAKATFAFAPDAEMDRVAPQALITAEVHHERNPARSVRFTTDLAPYLPRADVLFTGHAYPDGPEPVEQLPLRLALIAGGRTILDKTIEARSPAGLRSVPVVYERAHGGMDVPENPVGTPDPILVDPVRPGHPAGFGPIARAWPARKRLLGALPRSALEAAVAEIPSGFDGAYFQAAPIDQRVEFLRGDEWIVLEGLHPSRARLSTRLPGVRGVARIHGLAAFGIPEGQRLDLHADTLRLDGDEQCATVVWRQSFALVDDAALAVVQVVAGVELASTPITWPTPPFPRESAPRANLFEELTVDPWPPAASTLAISPHYPDLAARQPTMPFVQPTAALPAPPLAPTRAPVVSPWAAAAPVAPPLPAPLPPPLPASPTPAWVEPEAPVAAPSPTAAPRTEARAEAIAGIDLLGFDARALPRIRIQPVWRPLLDALREKVPDPDIDDPSLYPDPAEGEERREIFEVLAHGEPLDESGLRAAFKAAIRDDGRFVAPLVLLAGDLALPFDELKALEALAAAVTPLAGNDEALRSALEAVKEFVASPELVSSSSVAEALATRVKETYGRGKHALPLAHVEAQAERALVEHRRYQRRTVLGGRHLRALLHLGAAGTGAGAGAGAKQVIPIYLPDTLAEGLPMFPRFSARVVVEAHFAVDAYETHPVALRVVALARVMSALRW